MSRDESGLLYAETHEWVDVSDEGGSQVATIGISGFAIEQLNDLVFMDLPDVGKRLTAGEEFGEVESVKDESESDAPLAKAQPTQNKETADNHATVHPVDSKPEPPENPSEIEPKMR